MTAIRRLTYAQWLVLAAVLILAGLAIANFKDDDGDGGVVAFIVCSLVSILIAAGLLLRFAPQTEADAVDVNAPARRGVVLGVAALLTLIIFWTGLPFAFGIPALVLGLSGRERAPQQGDGGIAAAAIALGAGSVLLAFIGCLIG